MTGLRPASALLLVALLCGCDLIGVESPEKLAALREGEAKAIGSACRHAGRAIEDCYALNPKAQKAAVFAGWREMDEYMRENKIEGVKPTLGRGAIKVEPAVRPPIELPVEAKPASAAERKAAPASGVKPGRES